MMAKVRKIVISVLLVVFVAGLARADLTSQINGIIGQSSQKNIEFSVHIVKADTGQTVYNYNASKALIPASNMKVIITAAALKYLGSSYAYKTQIGLCGDSLAVIGSGDPLLGDRNMDDKYGRKAGLVFENINEKLKQNGITRIKDITVDISIFDDERVHPSWPREQLNHWYAAEVSGLNYNNNCLDMTVKNVGGNIGIIIEPKTDYVKITNEVVPITKGNGAVGAYRNKESNKLLIKGKCRKEEGPFYVTIEKPAEFFGCLLRGKLAEAGIEIQGQLLVKPVEQNCNFQLLVEYKTPIADCLARCNKNSLGLAAESLLKTIAASANPDKKNGSWAKGREIISQYLSSLGVESYEFYIDDGSGLSRENRLSANAITKVLYDVYKSKDWEIYRDSLAVGGTDGTISKYFKEEKYKGRILGKTGYIAGVKSFSGICTAADGDYLFSILTNNANGKTRDVINAIAKAIID